MAGSYELKRSEDQFMFNLRGGNNEIILTSERYKAKASAEEGIASVRSNASNDGRYERKTSSDGKPYFILKGSRTRSRSGAASRTPQRQRWKSASRRSRATRQS